MKSYNIAVEFRVPSNPAAPPLLSMLSFSLQDDTDPSQAASLFRQELLSVIAFAQSTGTYMPASTAILKAAKHVQDTFHCESFMLEANGKVSIDLC